MGIFDWFRREPPIATRAELLEFLDTRAAFLTQKNIFDFTHALAGPHYAKLIGEENFKEAVHHARWSSYPLVLSVVAEMVHVALLPEARNSQALADALSAGALEIFDRYPVPDSVGEEKWKASREKLVQRLRGITMHPPKPIKDIPIPIAKAVYDNFPFDERLKQQDFQTISHHMRVNLVRMHTDFLERAKAPALIEALMPESATAIAGSR